MNIKSHISFNKIILIIIAVGIWVIVFQNARKDKTVYISGGSIDNVQNIGGYVDIRGNVDVNNTVDVNLEEILGYKVGCSNSYVGNSGKQHVALDVYDTRIRW